MLECGRTYIITSMHRRRAAPKTRFFLRDHAFDCQPQTLSSKRVSSANKVTRRACVRAAGVGSAAGVSIHALYCHHRTTSGDEVPYRTAGPPARSPIDTNISVNRRRKSVEFLRGPRTSERVSRQLSIYRAKRTRFDDENEIISNKSRTKRAP